MDFTSKLMVVNGFDIIDELFAMIGKNQVTDKKANFAEVCAVLPYQK